MSRILVVGATGRIGRQVVSHLLSAGAGVRAMTRDPRAAVLPDRVEVVQGDLTIPGSLDACVEGVDVVFLVWTAPANSTAAAVERIAKRAKRVVYLTAPYRTPHPFFQQPNPAALLHAEVERQIEASGLRWTFLRPGMFAANALLWWAPQIRQGNVVRWPYGEAPTAPIDERDIAAVAVRALLDDAHDGGDYVLTGPQSLTQREQVVTIGDAIGEPLTFDEMSPDEARRDLKAPAAAVNMLLNAWSAALGQPAFVTSTVEEITGAPPRAFRDWATQHAAEFREQ